MANVRFVGRSIDVRELSAEDLKKAGVEGFTKTSFANGETVEVKAEVATALVENSHLFGDFEVVEDDKAAKPDAASKPDKAAKPSA